MSVQLDDILATIRQRESGGDYGAKAAGSSASGAYQFIDSTWRGLLSRYGVSGPPSARDAPPQLQDFVAARYVADILADHGGDLRAVPAVWYTGQFNPSQLDHVPSPQAGNTLSVRSYIDHWFEALARTSSSFTGPRDVAIVDVGDRPAMGGTTRLDAFLNAALSQQGTRYVFGAKGEIGDENPDALDCSGLVAWAAGRAGVELPHGSWIQYSHLAQRGADLPIDVALRTPGALLFTFSSDPTVGGRPSRAHVAISLGDGRVMEARNRRVGVLISDASSHRWTHAASIPELGTEVSTGWPVTEPLAPALPQFGLDSDGDGLLDEHELFLGTNPYAADTDLDGFTDLQEWERGTDPLDGADSPLTAGGVTPVFQTAAYVPPMTSTQVPMGTWSEMAGASSFPPVVLPPITVPPMPAPSAPGSTGTSQPAPQPPQPQPQPTPEPEPEPVGSAVEDVSVLDDALAPADQAPEVLEAFVDGDDVTG
jgi:cell wall-associated NlpC family hydrolase